MALPAVLGVDVVLFLTIGLLGGAHCIGMCGPLVTIYGTRMTATPEPDGGEPVTGAGPQAERGSRTEPASRRDHLSVYEVRQHALFNLGRTVSYTFIGAAMGALGGTVFLGLDAITAAAQLLRGIVGVLIGGLVIAIGVSYVLGRVSAGIHLPGVERVTSVLTSRIDGLAGGPGIVLLGGLHGLLPCPILYPAYLYAFASGSPTAGGIALAALGVGTVPAVFAYGTVIQGLGVRRRRQLHRILGVVFVVLGYVLLAHGLMAVGIHVPHPMFPFWNPLSGTGMAH
ncbi:sulfite exporter TauE/SafE family protein [Halopenitus sp. POP-27]|uniref:sulfite exporter TauE/SafE family protein n=1 Tax=Halopenitus sp. POP-27 TaxID=2994425 RepID=UPI0024686BE5|nr:sulfite exporter TauE/SafE family protein [Halopenitus sp. POP-27]